MSADERAKVFKALADPRRVEIVDQLSSGSQCGTQLAEALGISTALLCHHWDVLVEAGILRKERVGQLRVCTLDLERVREATVGWAPTRDAPAKSAKPKSPRAATRRRETGSKKVKKLASRL